MFRVATIAVALLAYIAAPRAAAQDVTGTASIAGTVVDARTGAPIAGATIELARAGVQRPRVAKTDGSGAFLFDRLPAGQFTATIRRAGYFLGALGQRWLDDAPRTLPLNEGEHRSIDLRLFKTAVIIGAVRDEHDDPVVNARVRAYRQTFTGGVARYTRVADAETDDRGMYRLFDLKPGDYLVEAALHQPKGWSRVFPPTFFPASLDPTTGTVLTLALGDVRRDADVHMRAVRGSDISGLLVEPDGAPIARHVELRPMWADALDGGSLVEIDAAKNGSFFFTGIPPGQYRISTTRDAMRPPTSDDAPPRWGALDVRVDGTSNADVHGLQVFLREPLDIRGRVVLDGTAPTGLSPAQLLRMGVEAMSGAALVWPPRLQIEAANETMATFAIAPFEPGRYVLEPTSTHAAYAIESVTAQGRDITGQPIDLTTRGLDDVVVTLTPQAPQISAFVTGPGADGDLAAIVVPSSADRRRMFGEPALLVRRVSVTNGRVDIRDLPPGDYVIAAVPQEEVADWPSRQAVERAATVGTPIHLTLGQAIAVDLKVVSLR